VIPVRQSILASVALLAPGAAGMAAYRILTPLGQVGK